MRRMATAAFLVAAMVWTLAGPSSADARLGPRPRPDYFTANDGQFFHRSPDPFSVDLNPPPGTASQTIKKNNSIALAITDAHHYADSGFYVVLGALKDVNTIVVSASDNDPGPFALNLWFDSNNDGDFFLWTGGMSHQILFDLGGDQYGLGPQSVGGRLKVNDGTAFYMQGTPNGGSTYTLAELKDGQATFIDGNTLVAAWVGICCGSSDGSAVNQSATIKVFRAR
ncbi:MAG: hypothetical protein E6G44_03260 [Actinobacteria bacterium]|nr:MAG: hypothetical protein E6G44_03260 [Actinomycetota bacterium]